MDLPAESFRILCRSPLLQRFPLLIVIVRDPDTLVTFLIGEEEKTFIIHKEYACYYVKVFDRAFNSSFIEGQIQVYRMADVTEDVFRFLVQWLYTQKSDTLQLRQGWVFNRDDESHVAASNEENMILVKLWVLPDRLVLPALQNLALNTLECSMIKTCRVATNTFKYIYSNTTPDSALRRYALEMCSRAVAAEGYGDKVDDFPLQMLMDLDGHMAMVYRYTQGRLLDLDHFHVPLTNQPQFLRCISGCVNKSFPLVCRALKISVVGPN